MRSRWLSRQALLLHLIVVVLVPTFLGLAWWQVRRAMSGDTLSYVYSFEWPFFAGYAVFMWWKLIHDLPGRDAAGGNAPSTPSAPAAGTLVAASAPVPYGDHRDDELAAYNRYLADLAVNGPSKQLTTRRRSRRQ